MHRKKAVQEFTVAQEKRGKQAVKENENQGRIKRNVWGAHEYQPLEYLRAIASNMSFWETVSIIAFYLCKCVRI